MGDLTRKLLAALACFAGPAGLVAQEPTALSSLLQERLRLGNGVASDVFFESITDARLDDDLIWVLERRRLLVFADDGALHNEIGREGEGPGEFLFASRLEVDSLITVHDVRLGRSATFSLSGELVDTHSLDLSSVGGAGLSLSLTSDRQLTVSTPQFSTAAAHDPYSHVILVAGTARDTVASLRSSGALRTTDGSRFGVAETSAGEGGAWVVGPDGTLAIADGYRATVRWHCAPSLTVCSERSLGIAPTPFGEDEIEDALDRLEEKRGVRSAPSVLVDTPPFVSVAREATWDRRNGSIWVQTDGDSDGGTNFLVVDRIQGVIDHLVADRPLRIRDVSQAGVLATTLGDLEEEVLVWFEWIGAEE